MAVKVTKPEINVREVLSELSNPTGTAGLDILRAETPQEVFNYIGAGRRNLIINGAMQVWQRGTSSSGALSNAYATADRWNFNTRSCTTRNISQQSFTVGQTDVPGNPEYYLRGEFSNNSGTNGPFIMQRIEGVQTGSGQTLTFSFWAKADSSQTITPAMSQQFGSGGSAAVDIGSTPSTITVGTSWERHTVTFDVPSISGKTIGTSSYVRADVRLPANTAITFDLAQVQLEVGKVATPFEHRSFGEELALCQRYYHQLGGTHKVIGSAFSASTSEVSINFNFPTQMRTTPSVSVSAIGDFEFRTFNNTALTLSGSSANVNYITPDGGSYWRAGESLGGQGLAGEVRTRSGVTGYIYFEAEL